MISVLIRIRIRQLGFTWKRRRGFLFMASPWNRVLIETCGYHSALAQTLLQPPNLNGDTCLDTYFGRLGVV